MLFLLGVLRLGAACARGQEAAPVVASVGLEGRAAADEAELRPLLPVKPGDPYDQARVVLSTDTIASFYQARGYLEARASVRVELSSGTARLRFSVAEGPRYAFGRTSVQGLSTLPERVVLRELPWKAGDPYDRRELFKAQGRIFGLSLFDDVNVEASTTPARTADVLITVRERPMKWIKAGVGYGAVERERLSLIFTHYNFLARAYRLDLQSTWTHISVEHKLEFLNRSVFDSKVEHRAQLSWRRETQPGYDLEKTLQSYSLGRRFEPSLQATAALRIETDLIFRVDPAIAAVTPGLSRIRALSLTLNRDTSNDPFYPATGTRSTVALERSGGVLGGNVHYNKVSASSTRYQRLLGPLIGVGSANAGWVREFSPSTEVPTFDRFFMGGANSVRGYRERGIGPKDPQDSPVGGNVALGASAELRFPLIGQLYGAAFLDGGQAGFFFKDVRPSAWQFGTGAGLRFRTPVGPFRLDVGFKLSPTADELQRWRLHLSLGEAF